MALFVPVEQPRGVVASSASCAFILRFVFYACLALRLDAALLNGISVR
jgi:hypothetical protein